MAWRRQATSHYLNQWWFDYRRIYASLGLNELTGPAYDMKLLYILGGAYYNFMNTKPQNKTCATRIPNDYVTVHGG